MHPWYTPPRRLADILEDRETALPHRCLLEAEESKLHAGSHPVADDGDVREITRQSS